MLKASGVTDAQALFTSDEAAANRPALVVTPAAGQPVGRRRLDADLAVPEGSTAVFGVRLIAQPAADVTVTVAKQPGGDADLTAATTSLTFTPANWASEQLVSVAAAEDADATSGSAVYTLSTPDGQSVSVFASEVENDTGVTTVSLRARDDAYVRDGTYAGQNFGAATDLVVKRSANVGNSRESLLTFDLASVGTISGAKLRLFGRLSDTTSASLVTTVYPASGAAWAESAVTWNNRPAAGPTAPRDGHRRGHHGQVVRAGRQRLPAGREGRGTQPRHVRAAQPRRQRRPDAVRQRRGGREPAGTPRDLGDGADGVEDEVSEWPKSRRCGGFSAARCNHSFARRRPHGFVALPPASTSSSLLLDQGPMARPPDISHGCFCVRSALRIVRASGAGQSGGRHLVRSVPVAHDSSHDRGGPDEAPNIGRRDAVLVDKIRSRASLRRNRPRHGGEARGRRPHPPGPHRQPGRHARHGRRVPPRALVEIAWADGHVSEAERDAIFDLAIGRGVAPDSTDMAQLRQWLTAQPPPLQVFECALDTIRLGLSVLPPDEAQQRVTAMINACKEVARASGGLDRLLALPSVTSPQARSTLAEIRIRMGAT